MIKPSILKDRKFKINRETGTPVPFCSPREKLSLGSLDDPKLTVIAHYNPHEFGVSKSMPWSPKLEQNDPKALTRSTQDSHEYKGTPSRSMTLELLFDNYEKGTSVKPIVDVLETLSTVRDPESTLEEMRRPHFCIVSWGNGINIRCIITSLVIKFTMFSNDGTPLRAVCTMELQEANLKSFGVAMRQTATDVAKSFGQAASAVAGFFRG